jgi:hypothetical protein
LAIAVPRIAGTQRARIAIVAILDSENAFTVGRIATIIGAQAVILTHLVSEGATAAFVYITGIYGAVVAVIARRRVDTITGFEFTAILGANIAVFAELVLPITVPHLFVAVVIGT